MTDPDYSMAYKTVASQKRILPTTPTAKPVANPCLDESDEEKRFFVQNNHIFFFSGVSKDSVYRLKEALCKINGDFQALKHAHPHVNITPEPIYLHINSFGGGVFAAFAGIDFIQQSPIPVHTIVEGATASAATLMSIVGKKRYIRPHASMLVHQLKDWFGGTLTEIDDHYKNVRAMHDTIKSIYTKHTRLSTENMDTILRHDLWWDAQTCIENGLADAIWTRD
jgi:ATP-dependent protease ClpP protease subunit